MNCVDFLDQVITTLTGDSPILKLKEDQYGAVISILVRDNVSLVIGKNGAIIEAIRIIAKALGYNGKHRIKLVVNDQEETRH